MKTLAPLGGLLLIGLSIVSFANQPELVPAAPAEDAQATGPTLLVHPKGYFLLADDAAGMPTWVKIQNVINPGGVITPPPGGGDDPPPTDPPPTQNTITQQVAAWTKAVDHPLGVQAMGLIYDTVAQNVKDGKIAPQDASRAAGAAADAVFTTIGGADKWATWRTNLAKLAEEEIRLGRLGTKDQWVSFLLAVRDGINQQAAAYSANPDAPPVASDEVLDKMYALVSKTVRDFRPHGF